MHRAATTRQGEQTCAGHRTCEKDAFGESSGEWRDATMDDLAADAVAALDFLRARPGVRADAVTRLVDSAGELSVSAGPGRHPDASLAE
ncbi:hypothetical protein GCM10023075_44910 [Streptosporangium album]